MLNALKRLVVEEQGQGMAEYGLILAGVAVLAMGALFLLGPKISAMFTKINTQLPT
ncbi:MAG: Flp family type IVb pilin [Syntrophomonas sp.]|nr:Flp family type IVb pilin [Syntrophomonas sp.]